MNYRALDDRLEAKWLLFLAALSAAGVAVSLFTGMLDLLRFTLPFFLACAFGAFVMTPSLRFRYSRWAQDGIVFAYIRRLPNGMRWVLTIHPRPRMYLIRQAWRLAAMGKFDSMRECDAALGVTDADLKNDYGKKLMLVTALGGQDLSTVEGLEKYVRAGWELAERHGCDPERIRELSQAAGTAGEALKMLDEGMPIEYVLAMGVR